MRFFFILIILSFIVIGVINLRFAFQCRKEQNRNKTNALFYVGDGKSVWIFGIISYFIGALEVIFLLFCLETGLFFAFLSVCVIVQWGLATFFWNHFSYSAVFICEGKIYFYTKKIKRSISVDQIADIKVSPGNVAYAFFNAENEILFEIQRKKENAKDLIEYIKEKV